MSRLLISAAHKSSGKTMLSVGLCAAFSSQGLAVQAFKKGPDYIDPMWLRLGSGRDCFNLDPYLMTGPQIASLYARQGVAADVRIVEGNKGLYDGLALDGSNSNAALAHLLDLPVLLVIDARGMTRGIAPLILGYQAFDPGIRIAGVILNQLGGSRHEAKLRAVIEHYTTVPVLGALGHDPALIVRERHLGLMPSLELGDAAQRVRDIGLRVAAQVDLQRILQAGAEAAGALAAEPRSEVALKFPAAGATPALAPPGPSLVPLARRPATGRSVPPLTDCAGPRGADARDCPTSGLLPVRIGVARDQAFGFYYPDDLEALRAAGATLVPFDTLNDPELPAVDGLFIGGGFPEVYMAELEANAGLRRRVAGAIAAGLPVYAECGGLMYLARSLSWRGRRCAMVGAIAADAVMQERPVGRGYVELEPTGHGPWNAAGSAAQPKLRGHEFHYSSLENLDPRTRFAYRVLRGHGVDGRNDGILVHNLLASYSHLRSIDGAGWAPGFAAFVRSRTLLSGPDHRAQPVAAPSPESALET